MAALHLGAPATFAGRLAFRVIETGTPLLSEDDARNLLGAVFSLGAGEVLLPAKRLDPAFFDLSNRAAGLFTQKFANYGVRLIVLGDISEHLAKSRALSDYVRESNRGQWVWFAASEDEAAARLGGAR